MKNAFLNKLLHNLDRVGPEELQNYLRSLARQKGFLEAIFNTLQEGILVINPEGRIIYFNHSVQDLLGFDPETAVGADVARIIKDLDWKKILREQHVISRDLEVFYPEPRYLSFYLVPLDQEGEVVKGFVLIFHDLTASREKAREAIESEKINALTLLAAGVAHELGNPLNSLNIHVQLLERDLKKLQGPPRERLLDSVAVVKTEIQRLDTIISQFLQAIRPAQPIRNLEKVDALVQESVRFLEPEIRDRDILVEVESADELPPLMVDSSQLKQAFYNVIKNAMQAMGKGGILRITLSRNDTHAVIGFTDNGSGISSENVARIFEPYFTTKKSGSGLGLLIVRRIVREHGGELEVESHVGRGTTVRILLPLTERRVRLLPVGGDKS